MHSVYCLTPVIALLFTLLISNTSLAAHPIYRASLNGPAIEGYDTVAYFTVGRAVRGAVEHQHIWRGATWLFSSAEHKALFIENPKKYAPQFGGYCAYAATLRRLYKGHPEVFTIEDGRLYFNNNSTVKSLWSKDADRFIGAAEEIFPDLISR